MTLRLPFAIFLGLSGVSASAAEPARLNQIQVIGTHNSYHVAPAPSVMALMAATNKAGSQALDYSHRPMPEQFGRLGIRQVELDVYADPSGGRYAEPAARKILKTLGKDCGPDPDENGKLRKPGLKVFHIQDIDYRSTAPTFVEALTQIRDWSRANPRHAPIFVLVELKDDEIPSLPTRPAVFGPDELDSVDAEIRSVFDRAEVLTPDDVRGASKTLPEAIRSRGWPKLDDCRGKVFFGLDNEGAIRDRYLEGHAALAGRSMFVTVAPDHPAAAWIKVNDPVKDFDRIQELVRSGFLVRTRADSDTIEARSNDPTRRDKALASGAQFVSSDFPEARPELSSYCVRLPGNVVARSNPISGDRSLDGVDLEGPRP